ncbi:MAG: choice-of-anchor Q domain-containing protein [Ilumatobacteraceae bacterium]|nr:choice-of-anchor Q domain-containing protein [Ilumatobacteraceae bacterium]
MSPDHGVRRLAPCASAAVLAITSFCFGATTTVTAAGEPLQIIVDNPADVAGVCPSADPSTATCSLRSAVDLANANPGSTVRLGPAVYRLDKSITITGAGTSVIGASVSGGGRASDHTIDAAGKQGIIVDADDVTIRGVTITGAGRPNVSGGAIAVTETSQRFHLASSSIENNTAREGAGVYVAGSATISGSTFVSNQVGRKGGAIRVDGTLELVNSTFNENTAQSGGAISVAGTASISYSTFVDNTSNNQKGGGVDSNGGNVYVTGSVLTRANQQSADGSDCSGNPDLIGPNFVGNAQGCQPTPATLVGTVDGPAGVGTLGDFGGPTLTMPLTADSLVLDRGTAATCRSVGLDGVLDTNDTEVATDQRGLARPSGAGCDLGAYELTPLAIDLTLTASTTTPLVGAQFLPSSAISASVVETDTLFAGTLDASPLNAFPLEAAPLNAFPLNAFPLNAFPLNAFPLNAFFTAAAPLNAFPLNAFPLNAFPLNAFPLSDLVLTESSWDEVLADSEFEGVPIHSLTLGDVRDLTSVQAISVGDINLEGTPLNAFPLNAFLLGSIPLNAFPLNAFGTAETWCDLVPDFCASKAGGVDPTDDSYTLASLALAGVPLNAFPLNAFPLNAFPLNAFPLNAFPLNAFPLNAFGWQSSPLNAFPLNAFPLNAFDDLSVIDCSLVPGGCDGSTLGDAFLAGAIADGAELGDLGALFLDHPEAFELLGDYSTADLLVGIMPPESIPWNEVDLTVPGIQNADTVNDSTFQYLAAVDLTAAAAELTVSVAIPPGFSYVPGGSSLDGTPVADPELSCPGGSCVDPAGEPTPITLTYRLADVGSGEHTLAIDTRAGFELGTFTASASASGTSSPGDDPATTGPSTFDVTVTAPDRGPTVPVVIETGGVCATSGPGDVNLGWVSSTTDGIDLYQFDISEEAARCGVRADVFLSNLPADYDVVLYGEKSEPLRGAPTESIAYLDDVTLDLNPFDDIVQTDTVQDIPQVLTAAGVTASDYAVTAISSNRARGSERIRTGTLRAGRYFIQVTGYNGAVADTPYALRIRTDATIARGPCDPLPYPGVEQIAPLPLPAIDSTLPTELNTLFITNSQLLEFTYGPVAADVLAAAEDVAAAASSGVVGAVLPVDDDSAVRAAYEARAADPCDPERSNDIVRAIGDVIDRYTAARPGIEYIVIVGDDRQVPMANVVDDANFANERTFSQDFAADADNESNAALAAGRYRTDDPYGSDAGIRIRDHELFVPDRAVGRLVETPSEIIGALENFVEFGGRLDPTTESRNALQTGYEFLTDGAELNASNLADAGYTVDDSLIGPSWTDGDLADALDTSGGEHLDVIGIHAHFDENNALPAFDNFNPQGGDDGLFSTDELPVTVDRSVVYSMGCHSGYSVSDVQIGVAPTAAPNDWAQELARGRTTVFGGNTGYGYGDTDRIALTEMLTAIFADEVGGHGSIGAAWAAAKQRMARDVLVLDAYQEKALQQFVLYGLPMFHVNTAPPDLTRAVEAVAPLTAAAAAVPDTDPITGQPIAAVEFRRNPPATDPSVPQFELVETPDGSYYQVDGRAITVNGHPIQPLYAADVPSFDGLQARDALITELTTVDAPVPFDPVFFRASPNFGDPRPEYLDGSFPAEMSTVRRYQLGRERHEQILVAAGQYRASDDEPDSGTQRLHTRVVAEVYYSPSNDFTPPAIATSSGRFDDDAIRFDIEVDTTAERVYVLYRAAGANIWSGVDLVDLGDGTWTGVGPFEPTDTETRVEYIVQAVDDAGNVAMSNSKSRYFLASSPGDVSNLVLTADGTQSNGWYRGDVVVTASGGGERVEYRVDAGPFAEYTMALTLSDSDTTSNAIIVDTGDHVVTAFDETGAFAALELRLDSFGPDVSVQTWPAGEWSSGPVLVTLQADDGDGSGVDPTSFEYSTDGGATYVPYGAPFSVASTTTVTARASDLAGNPSVSDPVTIRIDTVAPTVSISASTAVWTNQPVTITIDATDAGSGIAGVEYSIDGGATYLPYTEPFDFAVDGVTVFTARATDLAGNLGSAIGDDAVTVLIDREDPIEPTLVVASTVAIGNDITADYSCGDELSGIRSCELFVAFDTGELVLIDSDVGGGDDVALPSDRLGTYAVRVTATDMAGNVRSTDTSYEVTDLTAPEANLTLARTSVEMPATNTADYSCTDAGSGVASCVMTVIGPDGDVAQTDTGGAIGVSLPVDVLGTHRVVVTATDMSGNVGSVEATYTVVDTIAPTAVVSLATSSATIGETNSATFACTDDGSGIESCTVELTGPRGESSVLSDDSETGTIPVPVTQAGAYDVVVTATDRAGTTTTATASYTVNLCVIEQYDHTQSKQIGSNYTIKIQLCDATGRNISSRNIVLTAVSVTGSDGVSFPPGPNDSGNSNNGYEFRYAQKGYIYNLDTTSFPYVAPGSYTLNFTTAPVPDLQHPPPAQGSARFTLRR